MEDDIDMGPPRGRTPMTSKNNSRDSSIISTTSSTPYHEHMEIQNHNLSWCDQVEDEYNSHSSVTNVGETNISNGLVSGNNSKGKQHEYNEIPALNSMLTPPVASMVNNQHIPNTAIQSSLQL